MRYIRHPNPSKRGRKPGAKVLVKWSPDFAYAIGLLATDGCVSADGRHVNLTSKDIEQIKNFKTALKINNPISTKKRAKKDPTLYYQIQFSDVLFVRFLKSIGIRPAKSKIISSLKIPNLYFFDFLRGCFDGDGTIYSYRDKRWKSSYMFYVSFITASKQFAQWLAFKIENLSGSIGHIKTDGRGITFQLTFGKKASMKILSNMYKKPSSISLSRKKLKTKAILAIVDRQLLVR